MIIAFFSAILLVFSLQFFTLNFSIQGLNRAVIYAPIELFYPQIEERNNTGVIEIENFETEMMKYYNRALKKYVDEYDVSFYYYNPSDQSMCIDKYCKAVEVTVNADLILNYKYHRVMYYEIKGND